MSNNKQSSIEWLIEQMFKQGYFDGNKPLTYTNLDHLQEQAKAMHKDEIMDAWYNGFEENRPYVDHSEDYYKETFGGNNEQQ
jgi:hypothetical protein